MRKRGKTVTKKITVRGGTGGAEIKTRRRVKKMKTYSIFI